MYILTTTRPFSTTVQFLSLGLSCLTEVLSADWLQCWMVCCCCWLRVTTWLTDKTRGEGRFSPCARAFLAYCESYHTWTVPLWEPPIFIINCKPCGVNLILGQIDGIYKPSFGWWLGWFVQNASAYRSGRSTVALAPCLLKVISAASAVGYTILASMFTSCMARWFKQH